MPENPVWKPKDEILTFEEVHQLVELFVARVGVEQVRLTGGEPLLRRGVARLVAMLDGLRSRGLKRLSLSTNGALLGRYARELVACGLDDANVSLDSLVPERFHQMTGGGDLDEVLRGIEDAREAGLKIKINAVVMRGVNDGEVLPLATWAYRADLPLRFIEFMPLDSRGMWSPEKVFTQQEIIELLSRVFAVSPLPRSEDPARYYLLNGRFRLGIVSTVSDPFCAHCDRMRLTADGRLFACLFSAAGVDLKDALRANGDPALLESRIAAAIAGKPGGFLERSAPTNGRIAMHALGG